MTRNQAANMLREIKNLATEASLTGALRDGERMLADTYNNVRKKAIVEKWIEDDGIIPVLETDGSAGMDAIGCASALLFGLLENE